MVLGCVAVALLLGAGLGITGAIAAPTDPPFVVDSTLDRVDGSIDGQCVGAGLGSAAQKCTLRAAIQEANSRPGADTIRILPGTYPITIAPINENAANVGDFELLDPVTIEAAPDYLDPVVIDAGNPLPGSPPEQMGIDRLFEIHPMAGDVTFRNVTLQNGYHPEEGGAIQNWSLSKLTLDGVTIKDSFASEAGGGLNVADLNDYEFAVEPENLALLPYGRVEIKNSTFTGNGSGGGGAAINNVSGATITIHDSVVTLNPGPIMPDPLDPEEFMLVDGSDYPIAASAIGAQARYEAHGTIKITDSEITLNASEGPGAGISAEGDTVVTIDGSLLRQNRSASNGGGLYVHGGKVTITDTEVSKNQAASGGGLYSSGSPSTYGLRGRFEVTNSLLSENHAESGGGIYSDGEGQLFVTDSLLTKNFSSDHGAAISTGGRSNMTMTRVEVDDNESWGEGGGVWTHSERQHTIVDSVFTDNHAGVPHLEDDGLMSDDVAGGGGLHADGGPMTVLRTTFDGNSATDEGGGLSIHNNDDFVLRDSTVINNRALDGAGAENSARRVTFQRVLFARNHATAFGGGIHNTSSGEFQILDTTIRENSAVTGGGIANAPDNHFVMKRSLLLNNSARNAPPLAEGELDVDENAGKGGGLMSFADGDSLIENTTFSGNKAATGGGGLFHDADGELRLHHLTIWRNSAPVGGGIGVRESDFVPEIPPKTNAAVVVKNSIIGGSVKGGNCDWYVRSEGGNLETGARNTCFLAVTAETAQSPIELGVRDRRGDPRLWAIADNGGETLTHALQEGSLAIDSSKVPCAIEDARGVDRPQNGRCDAGAYEYEGAPPPFDATPPETIFNPATDGPVQDSIETMAFRFRGTDNLTAPDELNFECRFIEQDLLEEPEIVPPWEPQPPELMWNGCASPWSTPLAEEGMYVLEIRAIDRQDNIDPTPVSFIVHPQLEPPNTVIMEKPPLQTNSRSALFSFMAVSDFTPTQFAEFECRLDSRDPDMWLECFNPAMYANLTTGLHTFEVRAVSEAGNVEADPTPARYTWRVGPVPGSSDTPLTCDQANLVLTPNADGWADQVNPIENYLFETELDVRSAATDPGNGQPIVGENARAFLRFGIVNDAPDCVLESATLRLYSDGSTEGRTLEAMPLAETWKESSLTWFSQPDPVDVDEVAPATTPAGDLYREWDVTQHVEAIRAGTLPNHGWVIRDQHESDVLEGGDQSFSSRETPQDPPENTLPELVLRYVAANTPPPPPRDETLVDRGDVQCGEILTESTRLTADITGCLGEGVALGAPNIILDLNGHTISSGLVLEPGEEDNLTPGIRAGYSNVEVRGPGTVTNYGYGVLIGPGVTHSLVHGLTLYRNALSGMTLFDSDNGRVGNTVRGNRFDSNGETGMQLMAGTEGSLIEDNYFISNGMSIHLDAASRNVIEDNEISGIILDPALDSDAGIVLENGSRANILRRNDVSDTGDAGIVIHLGSHDNRVEGDRDLGRGVLVRNGDAGVIVEDSDRTHIVGITSHRQSDGGVVIGNSSGSSVVDSDLRYNPSGISASNTNGLLVVGNDASFSLQAGIELGQGIGMQVRNNVASMSGGSGISLETGAFDSLGNAVGGALIEGNTTNQNDENGISVEVARHTVRDNAAYNNAGFGILAGEEVTPGEPVDPNRNTDGGLNRASGNLEIVQCLGVLCDESGSVPLVEPDVTAPETIILSGPIGPAPPPPGGQTASEVAEFRFTANDGPGGMPATAMTFECRVDAPPDPVIIEEPELEPPDPLDPDLPEPPEGELWGECASPLTLPGFAPGTHKFEVRAVDHYDNFDLTPATYEWEIHAGVEEEGVEECGPGETLGINCSEPAVTPETRISAAPGELAELRNADAEPMLDELGNPIVYMSTTNRSATLRFVGSDNLTSGYNMAFECRIHHDPVDPFLEPSDIPGATLWGSCAAPKLYTDLPYGGHIFEVRSIDRGGNRDITPAYHSWWVHPPPPDVTAPDTTITSGPDATTVDTTAVFEFTGTDNQTPAEQLTYECRNVAPLVTDWATCMSPHSLTYSSPSTLTEHIFQVRAVDAVGNRAADGVAATYVWKVGPPAFPRVVFCGQTITESVTVLNSLGDCLGHGLIVGADNVTINLNGKTIDGKGIGSAIMNNGFDSVTVKNGTMTDFDFGVAQNQGSKHGIVEGVTVQLMQDAAVGLGHPHQHPDPALAPSEPVPGGVSNVTDNIVRGNTFVANTRGVWVAFEARENVIRGNLVGATSGEAILLERAHDNLVEGNDIQVASKGGVILEGAEGNRILGNSIVDVDVGVHLGATTVGTIGIESTDNLVKDNVVSDSSGPAVEIDHSSRNEVVDNIGTLVDSYTIELFEGHENVIKGNELAGNKGGVSLKTSTGNLIEGNNASESESTGIELFSQSFNNVLRGNQSNNNTGSGIYIGDETPAGQGTLVEGNTTNSNTGMGIYASKPAHIFRKNVAFDNDSWGMNVGDPSNGRANIDAGGNIAQGNEGPLGVDLRPQQCYNITCIDGPGGGDQIAPNTSLLETPLDPSPDDVAIFRFSGADNASPVTFECRLDSTVEADWHVCTSPAPYPNLEPGDHNFEVRAVDISGNADPTPASWEWTIALGSLMASVDSGPDKVTVQTSATFEFSANRSSGVTFECLVVDAGDAVDWSAAEACTSPKSYENLEPDSYEFWVKATDLASTFDTDAFAWRVGTPPVAEEVFCGQMITQSTRLTNDLVNCGGFALIVGAPGITIDLDGHVVDGLGLDAGILNPGYDDVTITNGLVNEFLYGVQLNPGTRRNVISNLRVEMNEEAGIALSDADQGGEGNVLRDNTIVGNEIGIALFTGTQHTVIRNNTLTANRGEGSIILEFSSQNLIVGNEIANGGAAGIYLAGGGNNTIRENLMKDNGGAGIMAGNDLLGSNGNLIERNTMRGGQGGVLASGNDNRILNNNVAGSLGPGITLELANDNIVRGNELGGSSGGIVLEEANDNLIESNNASGTTGSGIEVGELSARNRVRDNTASGNGGDGIEISGNSVVGQVGSVVENNTTDANGGDGVYVEGVGHTITGNVAQLNGGWGIYSVGGTDGGGNFAAGNMEPDQCFGVVCELGVVPGAPDTWIVEGPPDIDPGTPGNQTNSRNASFTYMGADDFNPITDIVFECRFDTTNALAWEDCEYPAEYFNLSPGSHVFEVRALDMLGQGLADPTPARYEFTYVPLPTGVPPVVTLDVVPELETWLPEAIFTFHANEPDVTFQCRVDSGGWEPCGFDAAQFMRQGAYEAAVEETDIGLHTFYVRAIDFEGNVGAPTTFTWRLLGILVTYTDGPGFTPATGGPGGDPATGGPSSSTSAEIVFEANVADAEFWCRFDSLDPGAYFPCSSPFRVGPLYAGQTEFPEPLLPGDHMLEVFAEHVDFGSAAELEPAIYEWEVVDPIDTLPPETTLERAPGPADPSSTIFEFSGTDDLTPPFLLLFQCQVTDGTALPNENDWVECFSPFNLLDIYTYEDPQMSLGQHTFYVRAIDAFEPEFPNPQQPDFEGNPDPTPASHTWTPVADTRLPSATITGGPANGAAIATNGPIEVEPYLFIGADNATPTLELELQCAVIPAPLGLGAAEWEPCESPHELSGVEPGDYTFAVRAVDLAGNSGPADTRAITVVAPPVVTILSGPDGRLDPISGNPSLPVSLTESAVFTFRSDQAGSTFECSLNGADFIPCDTPSGTGPGIFAWAAWVVESDTHEVAIRAINAQGVAGEEAVYEWEVQLGPDTTGPNTNITSGPQDGTLEQIAIFTFSGNDNRTLPIDLSFECALDSTTSWNSCVSPQQFENLTRGEHTLSVRAIDQAGIADPTPAAYTWTVASVPVATITSGPGVQEEETPNRTVTFEFTSDSPDATYHCWLDGKFNPAQPGNPNQPAPCTSPQTYADLGLGEHLFAVRAVDEFGNLGVWEDVEFMVTPSQARITSAPASGTGTTATFEFTSEPLDPSAQFFCSLDDRPFGLCSSPKTYQNLWPGPHTFQVQIVHTGLDWMGLPLEIDPVPATHTWTVQDFDPPDTTIDFGPQANTVSVNAYLGVSSDDPTAIFECELNGQSVECEPGVVVEITDLTPGNYTFTARAIDFVGNVDASPASHSWTVGTPSGPPNTNVGDNVVVSLPQSGGSGNATVSFFSVDIAGHTTLDRIGGGPSLPEGYGGASSRVYDISTSAEYSEPVIVCLTYNPADFGSPTPSVRLLHFDGELWLDITLINNPFSSPAKVCGEAEGFSLFAIAAASSGMAPEAFIISGPDGPLGPEGLPTSTSGMATFEFWVDQPNAFAQCSVDFEVFFFCTSPVTVGPVGEGDHEFVVQAINEFGWSDLTPAIYEWEVVGADTIPPSTVITKGPSNGSSTPNFITTWEFSGSDDRTPLIELEFECALDGVDLGGCETPEEIEVLEPGEHTLVVRAVDEAGNVDPVGVSRTWTTVDMGAPETEILTGPEEETSETTATFEFEGFDLVELGDIPVDTFECALDQGEFAPCTSPHTETGISNGIHVFHVRAIDADGNVDISPAFYEWLVIGPVDTTPPDTFIVVHPDPVNSGPDVIFGFASDEQVEAFECNLGDGTPPASPPAGGWQECEPVWFLEGLASGPHWLWVRALDMAEIPNVDPTPAGPFTWVTTGEPNTFITDGPTDPTGAFNATFEFESDQPGATFQCSIEGMPWTACTSPYLAGPFLPEEGGGPLEHEFEVRAVNQYTNIEGEQVVDMTPADYTWSVQDMTAPETEFLGAVAIGPEQFLDPGLRFTFRADDDYTSSFELTFECSFDLVGDAAGPVWEECGEPGAHDAFFHDIVFEDYEAGSYLFRVRGLDVAENADQTPVPVAGHPFGVEVEPETTIAAVTPDMGVDLITDATSVTFTFDGSGASFECALDSVTFTECSSPKTYTGIPYGTHLFRVQAVGEFGTRDLTPAEFEWESGHLTPPDLTLDSAPTDLTTSTTATFEFSSTDPLATFTCTLDGVANPCASGVEYTVQAGVEHTLEVLASKPNLLVEGTPVEHTWTVTDATAPDTFFIAPLVAAATTEEVVFTFAGEDLGGTPTNELSYECALDGAAFEPCSSPLPLSDLTGGTHTLEVRALDNGTLGESPNADASAATHTWQVVAPPATVVTGPVENGAVSTSPDAILSFVDQPGSTYECRLGAVLETDPFTACTSPETYTGLTNGQHVFEVRATTLLDILESPPASYEWEIDAPDAIAPNTLIQLGFAAPTTSTSATIIFGGTDNLTAVADLTYECRLDSSNDADWADCQPGDPILGLSVGSHTLEVRATDVNGNVDESPASHTWTVVAGSVNTPAGLGVDVNLGGGASATFENVTGAGITSLSRMTGSPTLPVGYAPGDAIYFDVSTTAVFLGEVEVCLPYDTGSLDEPHLLHYEGGEWVDVTTSLDVDAGIVCGLAGSLSPFGVAGAPGLSPDTAFAGTPEPTFLETEPGLAVVNFGFESPGNPLALFECSLDGIDFSGCDAQYGEDSLVGQHTLRVRAVDELTDLFDLTPAVHTWTVLARPVATVDSGPEDQAPGLLEPGVQNESRNASFTFGTDQSPSTFECRLTTELGIGAWESCTSPKPYTDLTPEEEYTFEVQATNEHGHTSLIPAEFDWEIVDLTPPNSSITDGPADPTSSTTATFEFDANEEATFQCTLDTTTVIELCTSPVSFTRLDGGHHTFEVLATDIGDRENVELAPAVHTWTIDIGSPIVTLGATTIDDTATFTFSATDNDTASGSLTFRCRIDDELFAPCTSPKEYTALVPGDHTFDVVTTDGAGNNGSASHTWTSPDLTAPETEITGTQVGSMIIHFSGSDNFSETTALTYECSLDGGDFVACVSPAVYENDAVGVGDHIFEVRALDEAGNVDPSPEVHTWTVLDTTAPETTITDQPAASTADTDATFTFGGSDDAAAADELGYECSLDGAAFADCDSPKSYSGLAVGSHTFSVRASDPVGNTDATAASYGWTIIDVAAPQTTITAQPDATTPATGASFSFTGSDNATASGALTFECALDGAAFALCSAPKTYSGLALGSHTFQVRATDAAGNVDGSPAIYAWTIVDAAAPQTSLTAQPPASTGSTAASFEFTGTDNITAAAALGFECSLDGATFAACTSPASYTGLAVGSHTFRVRAVDAAGNADASPAAFTWTVLDTVAPDTTITGNPPASTASTSASFAFAGSDDTTGAGALDFQCSLDSGAYAGCASPRTLNGLAPGSHTFQVRAVDAAGNADASPASYTWTILDTTAPETSITGQPQSPTTNTTATFTFTGSDNATPAAALGFQCALDGASFGSCTSGLSYSGLALGPHTFQVRASDATGNTDASPASYGWTIQAPADTTAPETTITGNPPATTTQTSASFNFSSSETPATFQCSLDNAPFGACATGVTYNGLAPGTHNFRVQATDAAGNTDASPASYSWTVQSAVNCGTPQTLTSSGDAWINSGSPTDNKGSDSLLKVMSKNGANLRALVRFNLPAMPQGCSVQSALLRIYAKSAAGGRTLQVLQVGGSWAEGGVNWSNQPATTGPAVTVASGTGYREWSVAAMVQAQYNGTNNGFLVRDATENQDAEQQFHAREESSNRPQLVLTLGNGAPPPAPNGVPETQITGNPLAATTSTSANFTFSGSDDVTPAASLTFQCQLDVAETAPWTACTNPRSYSGLGAGSHVFRVRAVDGSANVDPSPSFYSWTIDQTAPETVISNPPPATTTSTSASFQFTSSEAGSTFQCSLDNATFTSCASPQAYSGLAVGSHNFRARAIDAAGNQDGSPASFTWTIQSGGAPASCGTAQTVSSSGDSWIEQGSPSSNKGSDGILKVMSKSGNANLRALVRFDLPAIPSGCVIDTATLRLYAASASGSQRTLQALRLNGSWTEGGVNWSNQPATTGTAATTTSGIGYRQWSVASMVGAMYSSGQNNGFLIRDATEGQDAEQQFHAREKGDNPPQLVVTFKAAP